MPSVITEDDAASIDTASRLLEGSTVSGHWQHASLTIDDEGLALLRSASEDHGVLFEFTTDYAVEIGNHTIDLGAARYRLLQAFLAQVDGGHTGTPDEGDRTVELTPGSNDRFEISLVRDATGVAAALEQFAGRWIAQDGGEVVAVGDSPQKSLPHSVQLVRRALSGGFLCRVRRPRRPIRRL